MYLLTHCHQGIASKRIGIFTTDQSSNLAKLRIGNAKTIAIAWAPDQLLEECGHQLSMMHENLAVRPNNQI